MDIIQLGNKVLRGISKEIPGKKITSAEIKKLLEKMSGALRKEPLGIGLAAPQIGEPKAIFIVSEYVLRPDTLSETGDGTNGAEETKKRKEKEKYLVFINPKITKLSKKKTLLTEGCLSVAGKFGKVRRSTNLTIKAYDENGHVFTRGAGGLLAQVIQHEVDHLNGILFVDKVDIKNNTRTSDVLN